MKHNEAATNILERFHFVFVAIVGGDNGGWNRESFANANETRDFHDSFEQFKKWQTVHQRFRYEWRALLQIRRK
jgi:hypothetical protein